MIEIVEQGRVPIKLWIEGVGDVEPKAMQQIRNVASLPVVGPHIAIMPDTHLGYGAVVGSVVPTRGAIVPAIVGVDIGCGVKTICTDLRAEDLLDNEQKLFQWIEDHVPAGGPGVVGSWTDPHYRMPKAPDLVWRVWEERLAQGYDQILARHPKLEGKDSPAFQLGTLGTGNHFIEVCLDEIGRVWLMLHSGSRGVGNRIGTYFTERALEACHREGATLPDRDLGWLRAGTPEFDDYLLGLFWAQSYARANRALMMGQVEALVYSAIDPRRERKRLMEVECHHNYTEEIGPGVYLTRKGAVSAREGELGIIPGSMGTRSYITRGRGNTDSFSSCSHGAGRRMARGAAKRTITLADHAAATEGVVCRKDERVLDESPAAYKDIDAVMEAQRDLVEVVHTLRAVVCVKG